MQPRTHDRLDPVRAGHSPVEPYPDRESVPEAVERVFDHPEKVGNPDGVPHDVVGRIALGLVVVAAVGVFSWLAFGVIAAIVVGLIAMFLVFRGLPTRARRERTEEAVHEAYTPHPPARVTDERRGDDNA
jgi:Flp pilus assembly protein TadB